MPCKCGHGSKATVCNDCICAKKGQPCGSECHCRKTPGVTCNNPHNKSSPAASSSCRCGAAGRGEVCRDCVCVKQQRPCGPSCACQSAGGRAFFADVIKCCNPYNPRPNDPNAAGPGNSLVVPAQQQQQQQQWPGGVVAAGNFYPQAAAAHQLVVAPTAVVVSGTQERVQQDLRHDFEALAMQMTTMRDVLKFDPEKAHVYQMVFQMFFGAAERVVAAGRHPVAGYAMLECNGGSPELQHMLGTSLHKAELRSFRLENPAMMQWRISTDVEEAALRDFFTQLYERVKPVP